MDNQTTKILNTAPGRTFRVRLKKDDPPFELKAGDVLEVHRYALDPHSKFTVVRRVSDGYDPECNVYARDVERLEN